MHIWTVLAFLASDSLFQLFIFVYYNIFQV